MQHPYKGIRLYRLESTSSGVTYAARREFLGKYPDFPPRENEERRNFSTFLAEFDPNRTESPSNRSEAVKNAKSLRFECKVAEVTPFWACPFVSGSNQSQRLVSNFSTQIVFCEIVEGPEYCLTFQPPDQIDFGLTVAQTLDWLKLWIGSIFGPTQTWISWIVS